MKKFLLWAASALIVAFLAIQFVRPDKENPSVDPSMSVTVQSGIKPQVAATLRASCFDCHSNETVWPWYSQIAPVSWLVADDVRQGRSHLNFSEWGSYPKSKRVLKLGQIYEQLTKNEMPIPKYLMMHPAARLSPAERDSIISWTEDEEESLTGGN
ncbi:MAG TPA: heme-binding domain-containing protein [Bacteroidota bacterium]|nr:heme-binding domain-containing protein [Bacteroidota bacterium]